MFTLALTPSKIKIQFHMLEIFSILLAIIFIAKYIEDTTEISFVLSIIFLAYIANLLFDLSLLKENFHSIVMLMLPIILIPDVLGLSTNELKESKSSIFFLAFFGVLISIALAVSFTLGIGTLKMLSFAQLLLLFIPLMATDLVSVGAVFARFNLPSKLRLYAEGETLFNDITAMTLFFFVALPLASGEALYLTSLLALTLQNLLFSLGIGLFFGFVGYTLFSYARDNIEEFLSVYLLGALAFLLSEELHLSGVLSVVVAVMAFKYFFNKEGHYQRKNYAAALLHLSAPKPNQELSLRAYKKESHYLGFFANAVIFTSLATVIEIELLWRYAFEIAYVFILTTLIRALLLLLFSRLYKEPLRWANILTLAGIKGGLAIIMVISLGESFAFSEMFLSITLGVVILSIFVNTLLLSIYLKKERQNLLIDKAKEHHLLIKEAHDIFSKEPKSGALNEVVFEDVITQEIIRASRYKDSFLIVAFRLEAHDAKKIKQHFVRDGDYFGKIDAITYGVLMPHTKVAELISFTNRTHSLLRHTHVSVAEYTPNDTIEILYEKINSGFSHTASQSKEL